MCMPFRNTQTSVLVVLSFHVVVVFEYSVSIQTFFFQRDLVATCFVKVRQPWKMVGDVAGRTALRKTLHACDPEVGGETNF